MRSILCLLLLSLTLSDAQQFNLRNSSVTNLSHDHNRAGLKETKSIESMRAANTNEDGVFRLPTVVPTCSPSTAAPTVEPTALPTFSPSSNNNIPPLERQALQDLYNSTDGPIWSILDLYNFTAFDFSNPNANPCHLSLIFHCSSDYHVIGVDLYYGDLKGTIPSTIGQLSFLEGLYLHVNQLTGTIPSSIGQLSSLQYLDLNDNQLTGVVPSSLCQLFQTNMNNQGNQCYPESSLCQYQTIYQTNMLNIEGNLLQCYHDCLLSRVLHLYTGSTPVCSYSLERQALQDLYDSTDGPNWSISNFFGTGIRWDFSNPDANPCIEEWHGVRCSPDYHVIELILHGSNLRGTIPSTIVQLSYIQILYLGNNQLIGSIPSSISSLSNLLELQLSYNQLNGTIPSSFGASSLWYLDLSNNQLIGAIPTTIGQAPSALRWLDLSSNQLTGVIPVSYCFSSVTSFRFHDNQLRCYPECLLLQVFDLNVGSTPVCASEQPTAEPTAPSLQPTAQTNNMGE